MRVLLVLALLSLVYATDSNDANADDRRNCFRIKGIKQCFVLKGHALLSLDCKPGTGTGNTSSCMAAKALAAAKGIALDAEDLEGGKNPGAVLCQRLEGRIVIGADRFGNQEAFCSFGDKSMTNSSSLYYANQKKN